MLTNLELTAVRNFVKYPQNPKLVQGEGRYIVFVVRRLGWKGTRRWTATIGIEREKYIITGKYRIHDRSHAIHDLGGFMDHASDQRFQSSQIS